MNRIAYSYEEAATACGTSVTTIRRAIEAGDLIARKISDRVRVIEHQELADWINRKPAA